MRKANSWEYFDEIAKHHEENKDNLIGNISLEEMWETLVKDNTFHELGEKPFSILKKRLIKERICSTPLDIFQDYLDSGLYPPPEYLLWFSQIFNDYFLNENDYDLEEVMFGRKTPSIGTEKNRRLKKGRYESFKSYLDSKQFCEIMDELRSKPHNVCPKQSSKKKLTQMASDFINEHNLNIDLDSFLRGYRRYKNKKDK